jgi:hypothetical protein
MDIIEYEWVSWSDGQVNPLLEEIEIVGRRAKSVTVVGAMLTGLEEALISKFSNDKWALREVRYEQFIDEELVSGTYPDHPVLGDISVNRVWVTKGRAYKGARINSFIVKVELRNNFSRSGSVTPHSVSVARDRTISTSYYNSLGE